mmetsp:Transcript_13499/g.30604  ORF Transcript_13499/g.30604 Transcript_13499/m.30604 type:complete len:215 (+) Transcript_13499:110-754(+)
MLASSPSPSSNVASSSSSSESSPLSEPPVSSPDCPDPGGSRCRQLAVAAADRATEAAHPRNHRAAARTSAICSRIAGSQMLFSWTWASRAAWMRSRTRASARVSARSCSSARMAARRARTCSSARMRARFTCSSMRRSTSLWKYWTSAIIRRPDSRSWASIRRLRASSAKLRIAVTKTVSSVEPAERSPTLCIQRRTRMRSWTACSPRVALVRP